jgi:hypothetical protein
LVALQERHRTAQAAAEKLQGYIDPNRELELVHGNLLTLNISDATCVYMATTCWDAAFMSDVLFKIETECPALKWLVSTEDLDRKCARRAIHDATRTPRALTLPH